MLRVDIGRGPALDEPNLEATTLSHVASGPDGLTLQLQFRHVTTLRD